MQCRMPIRRSTQSRISDKRFRKFSLSFRLSPLLRSKSPDRIPLEFPKGMLRWLPLEFPKEKLRSLPLEFQREFLRISKMKTQIVETSNPDCPALLSRCPRSCDLSALLCCQAVHVSFHCGPKASFARRRSALTPHVCTRVAGSQLMYSQNVTASR